MHAQVQPYLLLLELLHEACTAAAYACALQASSLPEPP
jgi:hypothetical protein